MAATPITEMVTVVTRTCIDCGEQGVVTITASQRDALDRGAFVQDALPGVDRTVREQVLSGTHPGCWDALTDALDADGDDTDGDAASVEEEPASFFRVALAAFTAGWDAKIGAHEAAFALWEPDVDDDAPSIGNARPDAGPAEVVYITLHDPASPIELTAAATDEPIDLAARRAAPHPQHPRPARPAQARLRNIYTRTADRLGASDAAARPAWKLIAATIQARTGSTARPFDAGAFVTIETTDGTNHGRPRRPPPRRATAAAAGG